MKFFVLAIVTTLSISAAFAGTTRTPASKGACNAVALGIAEDEYGNDPMSTHVTPKPNQFYVVTVGIGNPEDGAHTYLVKCIGPQAANCGCHLDHEILPKGSN